MKKLIVAIIAITAFSAHAQRIEKELEYDKYTLADTFNYGKTVRYFQWDKVREAIRKVEQIQENEPHWGVLQNKGNAHGESPLVKEWHRDEYKRVADRNNLERWQSAPLYNFDDTKVPEVYGRDGSPVKILEEDSLGYYYVETVNFDGRWRVPVRYVKRLDDDTRFEHVIMVDRTMQTVMTLEHVGDKWLIRSMNPATTGAHNPPYQQPTPLGIHVIQEKKPKMFYTGDGNSTIVGFAPWASRFSSGGYVHGVPVNNPKGQPIEFGGTLGTIPRSHMCIRNATSHAKFVYDWAPTLRSLVVVIE